MINKLTKKYKRLEKICRSYWNEFDPIGVTDCAMDEEYDAYLPQTIKLVLDGADRYKIEKFITHCVLVHIGMSNVSEKGLDLLATKIMTLSEIEHG